MIESANLKGAAAKGLFWSALDRFGAQGIQFIFGIWISRILNPSDYGLLGMVLIFIAVGNALIDSGFGSALIWKKNPDGKDYSTVFFFNIAISFVLYLIFYMLAPVIAGFYQEPQLIYLIRIICLNFIILSFSLVQQTILQKRLDFKLLTYVNVTGSLAAGIVALLMAYNGFGIWAIVCQILIKSLLLTLVLWIYTQWRPLFVFKLNSLRELFGYGSKLTAAGLIYTVFQYLYFNIIGKLFPVDSLGLYTRASQLQDFPVKTGASIFNRVLFPVFASIQDDNERLKNAVRKTIRTMVFVMFPVILGLIAIADHLIAVLLTEKWLPASGYFKLLCISGIFYLFQVINAEILKTKGRSGWVLKVEAINKTILMANIFITFQWGISAIIIGQIITAFIGWILGSIYVNKLIKYSILQQFRDIFPYMAISAVMYIIIYIISLSLTYNLFSLTVLCLTGVLFYVLCVWGFKFEEMYELKKFFKQNSHFRSS